MCARERTASGGFTLFEILIALAILGGGLTILIGSVVSNLEYAKRAQRLAIAVDLVRGKLHDIEEQLLQDGFQELNQDESGDFADENWESYKWAYKIEKIELPGFATLQSAADGADNDGQGSASTAGGLGLIASQFETLSNILERSIRRITLEVTWASGKRAEQTTVVMYMTNAQGVNEVLRGLPAQAGASGSQGANARNSSQRGVN